VGLARHKLPPSGRTDAHVQGVHVDIIIIDVEVGSDPPIFVEFGTGVHCNLG
jgi:hypothetical protein